MLKIKDLIVSYDEKITLDINELNIGAKEKICLIGHSGSGKSTFLESIYGLREYKGTIEHLSSLSFVPQVSDLIPNFKVSTNILMGQFPQGNVLTNVVKLIKLNYYIKKYNKSDQNISAINVHEYSAINNILGSLNLKDKMNSYVEDLSGGEAQRVMLGRNIFENRVINLFDEPTSSLDYKNSKGVMEYILQVHREHTVICAIHDLSLINYFQRVLVFKEGSIILDSPVDKIDINELKDYFDEEK